MNVPAFLDSMAERDAERVACRTQVIASHVNWVVWRDRYGRLSLTFGFARIHVFSMGHCVMTSYTLALAGKASSSSPWLDLTISSFSGGVLFFAPAGRCLMNGGVPSQDSGPRT